MDKVAAGSEIHVGQPVQPLAEPVELALRDVVQTRPHISFAYVPVIALPDQPAGEVLVVFLRGDIEVDAALAEISAAVKTALDVIIANQPKVDVPALAVLPISLAHPLDGLAQAVLITDTMLHVTDVPAWQQAKNPKTLFSRAVDWLMGR